MTSIKKAVALATALSLNLVFLGTGAGLAQAQANLTAPTNVTATAVSGSEIDLSWTAPSETVPSAYVIYRDGSQVATTTASSTAFTDAGLASGTSYNYMVAGMNSDGSQTARSNSVTVMTLPGIGTATTSAPTNLVVTAESPSSTLLSWSVPAIMSSTTNLTGYAIYRDGAQVATTSGAGTMSFTDTGLMPSTSYTYAVAGTNSDGSQTAQSNTATVMTLANAGGTGTGLPSNNNVLGWMAIPLSLYNQMTNASSTSFGSTSPFTYINGYPMLNGNYIDCNGSIDNDPAHHTTDPNDTDPAHHSGQNCPGGLPSIGNNVQSFTQSNGQSGSFFDFNLINGGSNTRWVVIPVTNQNVQSLYNLILANPGV